MRLSCLLLTLALALNTFAQSDTTAQLMRAAKAYAKASEKQKHEKLIELTFKPLVKKLGGEQKMLRAAISEADASKRLGFELKEVALADPLPISQSGDTLFQCIPMRAKIEGPEGPIYSQGGLLGISLDGKNWTFVNLVQIEFQLLLEICPNLPLDLAIPPKQIGLEP